MNHKYTSVQSKIFDFFNYTIMILFSITTLYPFVYLISRSFASSTVPTTKLYLIPPQTTLENYARVFANEYIQSGYINTLQRTVIGTVLSLSVTLAIAYSLSKKYFPHKNFWTAIVVFTMFFDGGLIPSYLLVRNLGLMNSVWALTLPVLVSAYNLVITRNYMMGIPDSLEESARIDGANDIRIFWSIILPLCKPIIATVGLWIAVGHWNAWFDSMIYSTKPSTQVVQIVMRRIVMSGDSQIMNLQSSSADVITPEGLKAATIMVTTVPILCVYPFIQKYFVKGALIGSLKG